MSHLMHVIITPVYSYTQTWHFFKHEIAQSVPTWARAWLCVGVCMRERDRERERERDRERFFVDLFCFIASEIISYWITTP